MEKSTAGAAGAVDHVFGEQLIVVRVVVIFVADNINQAAPAVADADDLIPFAQRAISDAANRGVQSGNVAASGQNSDDAFLRADISPLCATFSVEFNR